MGMRGSGRVFLGSVNEKGNPISRLPSAKQAKAKISLQQHLLLAWSFNIFS
jgi:hypothetical protein